MDALPDDAYAPDFAAELDATPASAPSAPPVLSAPSAPPVTAPLPSEVPLDFLAAPSPKAVRVLNRDACAALNRDDFSAAALSLSLATRTLDELGLVSGTDVVSYNILAATTLNNFGILSLRGGRRPEVALAYFLEAVRRETMAQSLQKGVLSAASCTQTILNVGVCLSKMGRHADSARYAQRAIGMLLDSPAAALLLGLPPQPVAEVRAVDARSQILLIIALYNLGAEYEHLGLLRKAMNVYRKAVALARGVGHAATVLLTTISAAYDEVRLTILRAHARDQLLSPQPLQPPFCGVQAAVAQDSSATETEARGLEARPAADIKGNLSARELLVHALDESGALFEPDNEGGGESSDLLPPLLAAPRMQLSGLVGAGAGSAAIGAAHPVPRLQRQTPKMLRDSKARQRRGPLPVPASAPLRQTKVVRRLLPPGGYDGPAPASVELPPELSARLRLAAEANAEAEAAVTALETAAAESSTSAAATASAAVRSPPQLPGLQPLPQRQAQVPGHHASLLSSDAFSFIAEGDEGAVAGQGLHAHAMAQLQPRLHAPSPTRKPSSAPPAGRGHLPHSLLLSPFLAPHSQLPVVDEGGRLIPTVQATALRQGGQAWDVHVALNRGESQRAFQRASAHLRLSYRPTEPPSARRDHSRHFESGEGSRDAESAHLGDKRPVTARSPVSLRTQSLLELAPFTFRNPDGTLVTARSGGAGGAARRPATSLSPASASASYSRSQRGVSARSATATHRRATTADPGPRNSIGHSSSGRGRGSGGGHSSSGGSLGSSSPRIVRAASATRTSKLALVGSRLSNAPQHAPYVLPPPGSLGRNSKSHLAEPISYYSHGGGLTHLRGLATSDDEVQVDSGGERRDGSDSDNDTSSLHESVVERAVQRIESEDRRREALLDAEALAVFEEEVRHARLHAERAHKLAQGAGLPSPDVEAVVAFAVAAAQEVYNKALARPRRDGPTGQSHAHESHEPRRSSLGLTRPSSAAVSLSPSLSLLFAAVPHAEARPPSQRAAAPVGAVSVAAVAIEQAGSAAAAMAAEAPVSVPVSVDTLRSELLSPPALEQQSAPLPEPLLTPVLVTALLEAAEMPFAEAARAAEREEPPEARASIEAETPVAARDEPQPAVTEAKIEAGPEQALPALAAAPAPPPASVVVDDAPTRVKEPSCELAAVEALNDNEPLSKLSAAETPTAAKAPTTAEMPAVAEAPTTVSEASRASEPAVASA